MKPEILLILVLCTVVLVKCEELPASETPMLMKILDALDVASSDEHLFDVTLQLLKSLCSCMRDTLRQKEENLQLVIDSKSLLTDENRTNEKRVVLYREIYNNTCFGLHKELTKKLKKKQIGSDEDFIDNVGHEINGIGNEVKKNSKSHDIDTYFEKLMYKTLVETKELHNYTITRSNVLRKPTGINNITRQNMIIIISLSPKVHMKHNKKIENIDYDDIKAIIRSNKSRVAIDILNTKFYDASIETNSKISNVTMCNLQSLYSFLADKKKHNQINVLKLFDKMDSIKIYMDVVTNVSKVDFLYICCNNNSDTKQCEKNLTHNNFKDENNIKSFQHDVIENYEKAIGKIKGLVKLYDENFREQAIYSTNINSTTDSDCIRTEALDEKSIIAVRDNLNNLKKTEQINNIPDKRDLKEFQNHISVLNEMKDSTLVPIMKTENGNIITHTPVITQDISGFQQNDLISSQMRDTADNDLSTFDFLEEVTLIRNKKKHSSIKSKPDLHRKSKNESRVLLQKINFDINNKPYEHNNNKLKNYSQSTNDINDRISTDTNMLKNTIHKSFILEVETMPELDLLNNASHSTGTNKTIYFTSNRMLKLKEKALLLDYNSEKSPFKSKYDDPPSNYLESKPNLSTYQYSNNSSTVEIAEKITTPFEASVQTANFNNIQQQSMPITLVHPVHETTMSTTTLVDSINKARIETAIKTDTANKIKAHAPPSLILNILKDKVPFSLSSHHITSSKAENFIKNTGINDYTNYHLLRDNAELRLKNKTMLKTQNENKKNETVTKTYISSEKTQAENKYGLISVTTSSISNKLDLTTFNNIQHLTPKKVSENNFTNLMSFSTLSTLQDMTLGTTTINDSPLVSSITPAPLKFSFISNEKSKNAASTEKQNKLNDAINTKDVNNTMLENNSIPIETPENSIKHVSFVPKLKFSIEFNKYNTSAEIKSNENISNDNLNNIIKDILPNWYERISQKSINLSTIQTYLNQNKANAKLATKNLSLHQNTTKFHPLQWLVHNFVSSTSDYLTESPVTDQFINLELLNRRRIIDQTTFIPDPETKASAKLDTSNMDFKFSKYPKLSTSPYSINKLTNVLFSSNISEKPESFKSKLSPLTTASVSKNTPYSVSRNFPKLQSFQFGTKNTDMYTTPVNLSTSDGNKIATSNTLLTANIEKIKILSQKKNKIHEETFKTKNHSLRKNNSENVGNWNFINSTESSHIPETTIYILERNLPLKLNIFFRNTSKPSDDKTYVAGETLNMRSNVYTYDLPTTKSTLYTSTARTQTFADDNDHYNDKVTTLRPLELNSMELFFNSTPRKFIENNKEALFTEEIKATTKPIHFSVQKLFSTKNYPRSTWKVGSFNFADMISKKSPDFISSNAFKQDQTLVTSEISPIFTSTSRPKNTFDYTSSTLAENLFLSLHTTLPSIPSTVQLKNDVVLREIGEIPHRLSDKHLTSALKRALTNSSPHVNVTPTESPSEQKTKYLTLPESSPTLKTILPTMNTYSTFNFSTIFAKQIFDGIATSPQNYKKPIQNLHSETRSPSIAKVTPISVAKENSFEAAKTNLNLKDPTTWTTAVTHNIWTTQISSSNNYQNTKKYMIKSSPLDSNTKTDFRSTVNYIITKFPDTMSQRQETITLENRGKNSNALNSNLTSKKATNWSSNLVVMHKYRPPSHNATEMRQHFNTTRNFNQIVSLKLKNNSKTTARRSSRETSTLFIRNNTIKLEKGRHISSANAKDSSYEKVDLPIIATEKLSTLNFVPIPTQTHDTQSSTSSIHQIVENTVSNGILNDVLSKKKKMTRQSTTMMSNTIINYEMKHSGTPIVRSRVKNIPRFIQNRTTKKNKRKQPMTERSINIMNKTIIPRVINPKKNLYSYRVTKNNAVIKTNFTANNPLKFINQKTMTPSMRVDRLETNLHSKADTVTTKYQISVVNQTSLKPATRFLGLFSPGQIISPFTKAARNILYTEPPPLKRSKNVTNSKIKLKNNTSTSLSSIIQLVKKNIRQNKTSVREMILNTKLKNSIENSSLVPTKISTNNPNTKLYAASATQKYKSSTSHNGNSQFLNITNHYLNKTANYDRRLRSEIDKRNNTTSKVLSKVISENGANISRIIFEHKFGNSQVTIPTVKKPVNKSASQFYKNSKIFTLFSTPENALRLNKNISYFEKDGKNENKSILMTNMPEKSQKENNVKTEENSEKSIFRALNVTTSNSNIYNTINIKPLNITPKFSTEQISKEQLKFSEPDSITNSIITSFTNSQGIPTVTDNILNATKASLIKGNPSKNIIDISKKASSLEGFASTKIKPTVNNLTASSLTTIINLTNITSLTTSIPSFNENHDNENIPMTKTTQAMKTIPNIRNIPTKNSSPLKIEPSSIAKLGTTTGENLSKRISTEYIPTSKITTDKIIYFNISSNNIESLKKNTNKQNTQSTPMISSIEDYNDTSAEPVKIKNVSSTTETNVKSESKVNTRIINNNVKVDLELNRRSFETIAPQSLVPARHKTQVDISDIETQILSDIDVTFHAKNMSFTFVPTTNYALRLLDITTRSSDIMLVNFRNSDIDKKNNSIASSLPTKKQEVTEKNGIKTQLKSYVQHIEPKLQDTISYTTETKIENYSRSIQNATNLSELLLTIPSKNNHDDFQTGSNEILKQKPLFFNKIKTILENKLLNIIYSPKAVDNSDGLTGQFSQNTSRDSVLKQIERSNQLEHLSSKIHTKAMTDVEVKDRFTNKIPKNRTALVTVQPVSSVPYSVQTSVITPSTKYLKVEKIETRFENTPKKRIKDLIRQALSHNKAFRELMQEKKRKTLRESKHNRTFNSKEKIIKSHPNHKNKIKHKLIHEITTRRPVLTNVARHLVPVIEDPFPSQLEKVKYKYFNKNIYTNNKYTNHVYEDKNTTMNNNIGSKIKKTKLRGNLKEGTSFERLTLRPSKKRTVKYNTYQPTHFDEFEISRTRGLQNRQRQFKQLNRIINYHHKSLKNTVPIDHILPTRPTYTPKVTRKISLNYRLMKPTNTSTTTSKTIYSKQIKPPKQSTPKQYKSRSEIQHSTTGPTKVSKDNIIMLRTSQSLLDDPLAKTLMYPVIPKRQRNIMRPIEVSKKTKSELSHPYYALNQNEEIKPHWTPQRRFKPLTRIIQRPKVLPPIFRSIEAAPKPRTYFRPKPLMIENLKDEDFYKANKDVLTENERVNFLFDTVHAPFQNLDTFAAKPAPYIPPLLMKPKFIRDRVDSIRSYIASYPKLTTSDWLSPFQKSSEISDDQFALEPYALFYPNRYTTETTTPSTTKRRGRTIFFYSPTVPYNRYF